MQKYSEYKGAPVFDWNKFLRQENYKTYELSDAVDMASSWVTCACGEQCAIIPRSRTGAPHDCLLFTLGMEFLSIIKALNISYRLREEIVEHQIEAIKILKKIEARSAYLIDQIINRKPFGVYPEPIKVKMERLKLTSIEIKINRYAEVL